MAAVLFACTVLLGCGRVWPRAFAVCDTINITHVVYCDWVTSYAWPPKVLVNIYVDKWLHSIHTRKQLAHVEASQGFCLPWSSSFSASIFPEWKIDLLICWQVIIRGYCTAQMGVQCTYKNKTSAVYIQKQNQFYSLRKQKLIASASEWWHIGLWVPLHCWFPPGGTMTLWVPSFEHVSQREAFEII